MAALLFPSAVLAQPPQWPNADDLARAPEAHPFPTPARIEATPRRAVPSVPDTRAPAGAVDLETMARHGATLSAPAARATVGPALQIFITLEMPQASLQRLVDQAARSGATLVLRGLKTQSLRATLAAVKPLIEARRVAWVIDPQAFARYQITVAPTFVLTLSDGSTGATAPPCDGSAAIPRPFVSVAGDVSLDYALEAIAKRSPAAAPEVSALLERLRGS